MNKPNSDLVMNTEGWKTINWRQAERYVFKLQKRIYAASRRGEVKQCRKLQKTLMRSWSNRVLAVRRVTQDNQGKKTAGVDGIKSLPPKARLELVGQLKLTGKSKPTRRVWIPKPGREEKRPLGIGTMYDRALQAVVKATLEPEWEAAFEPNSYGFRPGRSCHDAIKQIKNCIQGKAKFVLDADIAKCFDRINHEALLQKLNIKGKVRRQIKSWLKSGVIDSGAFTATSEGTPQGGVISPLLANIALHGLEEKLKQYAETLPLKKNKGTLSKDLRRQSLTFIRYADDFVVFHKDKAVVQRCREIISEWLAGIGLELKPEKTRLTHTLNHELSEDGKAGFDFLGHHIQQYPAGKYRSSKDAHGKILGFNTLITPSKKASKAHQEEIGKIITKHRSSPQTAIIKDLNPVIRGWTSYFSKSDVVTVGELSKQDYLTYLKLRRWAKRRCGNINDGHIKYWTPIGDNNWVFATREGTANSLRLLNHNEFACSSTDYVKVKGDKSPYDGDTVYWSKRLGTHPQMPNRKAKLLKLQKGKCPWCGLSFQEWDVLEIDHIISRAEMGTPGAENSVQRMADVTNTAQIVELWKSSKRSPETRRSYETDIRYFIAFVLGVSPKLVQLNDLDLRTVTMNDVLGFADYLETKKYEASTRARKLAAIKSLLRFALKVEWTKFNVAAEVPLPEPKDKLAERLLSEVEVMTMIALTPKGRDRLVIQLLYYTGARVSEIAVLCWRSVQPGWDGNGQVTLYGKGQKTRTVAIPKNIYQELLVQRTNNSPDAPVFVNRQGGAVGERRIRKIVAESGKRAGISGNVSPHWLRHSHATHSLDRGAPLQLLQATLGHSSLNQTSRYTHARPNDSTGLYLPK